MRRRFVLAVGSVTLATAFGTLAQQPVKVRRIGMLTTRARPAPSERGDIFNVFLNALRDLGYVEGKNLAIEWRSADNAYERLPKLATELVALNPELIVSPATPPTEAARRATSTIPIVAISVADPVESGFAASLARPGGNVTGLANITADLSPKLIDLLKTVRPAIRNFGVLTNPKNSTHQIYWRNIQSAAQKLGLKAIPVEASTPDEIERAFATLARERVEALVVAADSLFLNQRQRIAPLAIEKKMVTVFPFREDVIAGGLMSYGPSLAHIFRRAASIVDRILRGAKPGEMPFEQPTQFELVINLRTAKVLGIKFPQTILSRADQVIE